MKTAVTSSCMAVFLLGATACDDEPTGTESRNQVVAAWTSAKLGPIDLAESNEKTRIAGGKCREGTVANLQVNLCEYKDALAANSAKEEGLERIGSKTGAALVRDRYLLVVADANKVDIHGKVLNQVAKIFLKPPSVLRPQ